jgi:hypothetical protein
LSDPDSEFAWVEMEISQGNFRDCVSVAVTAHTPTHHTPQCITTRSHPKRRALGLATARRCAPPPLSTKGRRTHHTSQHPHNCTTHFVCGADRESAWWVGLRQEHLRQAMMAACTGRYHRITTKDKGAAKLPSSLAGKLDELLVSCPCLPLPSANLYTVPTTRDPKKSPLFGTFTKRHESCPRSGPTRAHRAPPVTDPSYLHAARHAVHVHEASCLWIPLHPVSFLTFSLSPQIVRGDVSRWRNAPPPFPRLLQWDLVLSSNAVCALMRVSFSRTCHTCAAIHTLASLP